MKTNHKFAHFSSLTAIIACLLSSPSSQAQTLASQEKLTTPAGFEAVAYPVSTRPVTIQVNFNNLTAGGVRVTIRDEKGREFYSEFEKVSRYCRRFDLSPLPAGKYTVELSKANDRFTQTFTIEPPATSYITMENQPVLKKIQPSVEKKLIVSQ